MERSELRSKNRKRRPAKRCLALAVALSAFASLAFPNYGILPKVGAMEEVPIVSLAGTENKMEQLAHFEFDDSDDRLKDSSGNGVIATIVDNDSVSIIGTDDRGNYLDLTKSNAYLSLPGNILNGLEEMTVEMRVKSDADGANWSFFAAPNGNNPGNYPSYLGVLLNGNVKVERFANGRGTEEKPADNFYGNWDTNGWHTIRVVFDTNSTTLYIDDEATNQDSDYTLAQCLGNDCGVLWFGHSAWGEYFSGCIDDIKIWDSASDLDDDNLIVSLDFEGEGEAALTDKSANGVAVTLENGPLEHDFFDEDNGNTYLDLSNRGAYLSLTNYDGSGVLDNMAEVAVEMRLYMMRSDNTQWPFYAAPVGSAPSRYPDPDEHYLSVHLANGNAYARRYDGPRPNGTPNNEGLSANLTANEWYTVKVVYEAGKTTLYVTKDGGETVTKVATDLSANLWDCLGTNSFLWFGYSGWGGIQYFNGYIDDITIWGTSRDNVNEPTEVEDDHIITKDVVDPANTTVNMFDYWVFGGQNDRDYGLGNLDVEKLINGGINNGHLFLFDGSASINLGDDDQLGLWNRYSGTPTGGKESNWGIVRDTLYKGYPQLALDDSWAEPGNETLKRLWSTKYQNESLAYLFDPKTEAIGKNEYDEDYQAGKASYPNVTGLFRINDDGYYYFRSQEVFAELNAEQAYDPANPKTSTNTNHITLYDTPWREEYARGQFFPFNDWTELFYEVNGNIGQWGNQGYQAIPGKQPINHWFGMTIETEFMQPANGTLYNGDHMTFEFSGDDDVWIFIDDVLVADVGGNHSRIRVKIDYSTGEIVYQKGLEYTGMLGEDFSDARGKTTLKDMFTAAGKVNETTWNGNTFGNNTIHTLKFFYLERGNAASNCNISFNLQEPIVDRIRKVDQNGNPLAGAEFALYPATAPVNFDNNKWWLHTADEFTKTSNKPITTTVSNGSGYAPLTTENGGPLDLSQSDFYILEETKTPAGYRKNPPIVLQYHKNTTNTLTVVNKYEVGAYASFLSEWSSKLDVNFANYSNKKFTDSTTPATDQLEKGLAIVVPVVMSNDIWHPMYGSNTLGWNTVQPLNDTEDGLIKALAEAAFRQIADTDPKTQHWYLHWDGTLLKGQMENLPGDATRYVFNNGNDGELVTLFLSEEMLKELGLNGVYADDNERYTALSKKLAGKDAKELAEIAAGLSDLKILYTENFVKNNRTVIYVPNEQQELRVRKVDEKDKPMEGTVFALFDTAAHAAKGDAVNSAGVLAYGTTGKNGELIFRASGLTNNETETGYGYAKMNWISSENNNTVFWLKEITAPKGYELNENLIRVEVGSTGIYANATGFGPDGRLLTGDDADNDGIKVEASLGRLTQTLVKYAEGIVDETLKYITAAEQTANSIDSWADDAESEDMIYAAGGYDSVKFTAESGYIRVMPRQTAHITEPPAAKRDDLKKDGKPINLDGLFSLINTVVVSDQPISDTDDESSESSEPSEPNESSESSEPSEPNESGSHDDPSEPSTPNDNPETGVDMRFGVRFAILTLSLIAALSPQRKRGKLPKN